MYTNTIHGDKEFTTNLIYRNLNKNTEVGIGAITKQFYRWDNLRRKINGRYRV